MMRAGAYMSVAALLVASALLRVSPARADDAIDAWARWALTPKVWKGQIVATPPRRVRPAEGSQRLVSLEFPVQVHARRNAGSRAQVALDALEDAYVALRAQGWPLPVPDADLGASAAFDLYLVPGVECASEAAVDEQRALSDFDAALTYAIVSEDVRGPRLAACVHSAFAQATARALEPAESASIVRATGEYAAYRETGAPGCDDSMIAGQGAPEHSMLGADRAAAGSGALFLAMLSERHDAGSGEFVRALWELARQHSKGLVSDDRLRGSPDVWEVLARVLESSGEQWTDAIADFGTARFFAGDARRRAAASFRVFAELPSDGAVPLLADVDGAQLPKHVRTAADGGIEPLGSAYVRVRLSGEDRCAAGRCELRVWLRGETGPEWSLTAVQIGAEGAELGRTRAPARKVPESYLPVLVSSATREVILIATHLPRALPDADRGVGAPRGVELTIE